MVYFSFQTFKIEPSSNRKKSQNDSGSDFGRNEASGIGFSLISLSQYYSVGDDRLWLPVDQTLSGRTLEDFGNISWILDKKSRFQIQDGFLRTLNDYSQDIRRTRKEDQLMVAYLEQQISICTLKLTVGFKPWTPNWLTPLINFNLLPYISSSYSMFVTIFLHL